MRKLASVQVISNLEPIEGADKIEKATVLGWQVIVLKGEYTIGGKVVYVEIDSILPPKKEFEFLEKRKYRIRTIKLRNTLSQGICFPLSILPKGNYEVDDDVTEVIGIKKYDPQAAYEAKLLAEKHKQQRSRLGKFLCRYSFFRRLLLGELTKIPFPAFIKKTDEERIQNIKEMEYIQMCSTSYYCTEKLDGTSFTAFCIRNPNKFKFWEPYIFGVCSRNYQLVKPDASHYWYTAKKYDLKNKMIAWCKERNQELVMQGEIIGNSIQNNKYKLEDRELYLFNVICKDNFLKDNRMTIKDFDLMINPNSPFKDFFKIKSVPFLGTSALLTDRNKMLEYAKGKSVLNSSTLREGVVFRDYHNNTSFKIINNDFLLKYGE